MHGVSVLLFVTLSDEGHEQHSGEDDGQEGFVRRALGHEVEYGVQQLLAHHAHHGQGNQRLHT